MKKTAFLINTARGADRRRGGAGARAQGEEDRRRRPRRVRARAQGVTRAQDDEERRDRAASRQRHRRGARGDGRTSWSTTSWRCSKAGGRRTSSIRRCWHHDPSHHRRHRQPVPVARSGQGGAGASSIPTSACRRAASADDIIAVAHDADAVIVCYAQITAAVIGALTRCKVIGRTGLGVDNIDVPAAAARGITVTYVPDYCLREVSDHAMALLLALARKIPFANKLVQSGRWELPPIVPLRRLEGQVLGLDRLRQHPARGRAEGEGVRAQGDHARSLRVEGRARVRRRRGRELRRSAGALRFHLGARAADAGDARPRSTPPPSPR